MIGTTLNGRFHLERELGRGGMGAVYRAIDDILGRPVAIKILKEVRGAEVSRRIRLEAQILARLLHENIVRLYDFSVDGETYYFIMEEVDGPSFARRYKKIGINERLAVVSQTALALDYAHHQGVIHRDVKPANILLNSTDQAKLSDFGLSLLADSAQESGVVRGTPHYMSPEQAKGRKIDFRTDLYALGVILYECATGTPPFSGPVMSVMSQHIHAEPPAPRLKNPHISEEFQALILALMAKDPTDRPASGAEVSARLKSLVESGKVATPGPQSEASEESAQGASHGSRMTGVNDSPGSAAAARLSVPVPSMEITSRKQDVSPSPRHAIADRLVGAVSAEPIILSPDERYLHGQYLAYLLGGSRRRGFLLRRPLDPINGDRARLLLAMTALTLPEGEGVEMSAAASLLEDRPDVRPMLSPVVVAKYLAARSTPAKRKRFRQLRQLLQQSSEYAARHLTDEQGVLNPGLMPQTLDDLRRLAPVRTEVDDLLVERWNQVSEVWRVKPQFRDAVLRYATKNAWKDQASSSLWPEVVYPLIERAQRQRQLRSGPEAVWDAVCGNLLHVGDAGVKMDREIRTQVPHRVQRELELELYRVVDDLAIEAQEQEDPEVAPADAEELPLGAEVSAASFHDLQIDQPTRSFVRMIKPDPMRLSLGELKEMWMEAAAAMKAGSSTTQAQRSVSLGLYRLVVVPSIRSRSACQLAIQGMANKQVELLVPPISSGGPTSKILIAVWLFTNNSMAITYLDHLNVQKFTIWDAPVAQQTNFDDPTAFVSQLYAMGLQAPEQIDRVLLKSYQPYA